MNQNNSDDQNKDVQDAPKFGREADTDSISMDEQYSQGLDPIANGNVTNEGNKRDEEFAQELTANDFNQQVPSETEKSETGTKTAFGWFAVIASISSFFLMPIFLSVIGIIIGFVAKSRGADTLGNTAIIAGVLSLTITLFIVPFF